MRPGRAAAAFAIGASALLAGCADNSDDSKSKAIVAESASPTLRDFDDLASGPPLGGQNSSLTLIRSKQTTEARYALWLATRNGPGGPGPAASGPPENPEGIVYVCVSHEDPPRQISQPANSGLPKVDGARLVIRDGKVTTEAVGEGDRLAQQLDGLQ
jgi:hypothetical protein